MPWLNLILANPDQLDAALATIRAEIADPASKDRGEMAGTRILALRTLAKYSLVRAPQTGFDEEARV